MTGVYRPAGASCGLTRRHFLRAILAGVAAPILSTPGINLTSAQAPALLARRQAGTLSVAWSGAPVALDPLNASADTEIAFLNAIYDYLLDTDARSGLVPRLATGWTVSDDGRAVTLTIAEGVTFHDGSALTLDDIVWTFDRLRSGGPTADLYADIERVAPGEGSTIVFTLRRPNPDFLYNLTDNHAVILKANAGRIGEQFNGTGPFRLESYSPDRATLAANPAYFGGSPALAGLEFFYFDSVEGAVSALRGGQVDAVLRMDNATFLALEAEGGFVAQEAATSGHDLVRLRADRAPGSDVRVRQAFRLATDRQAIFDRLQFGFGSVGRDSPIAPFFERYYTEETPLPIPDADAARQLLTEAGYPDGLEMTLYVPNLADRVALAQALAAQWEAAGIRITIEPQEEAVYYADNGWLEVDLAITPWGHRPVPQVFLDLYLRSGAQWNESHFSDEEVDRLIEIAGTTLDETERTQAYHDIQRILIERGPLIIPYFFAQFGVMGDYVSGVEVHPFAGRTRFDRAAVR